MIISLFLRGRNKNIFALFTAANMCATLAAPTDGSRDSEAGMFVVGGTLTFTCDAGFTLTGTGTVTCQPDGNFDAIAPTCGKSYNQIMSIYY